MERWRCKSPVSARLITVMKYPAGFVPGSLVRKAAWSVRIKYSAALVRARTTQALPQLCWLIPRVVRMRAVASTKSRKWIWLAVSGSCSRNLAEAIGTLPEILDFPEWDFFGKLDDYELANDPFAEQGFGIPGEGIRGSLRLCRIKKSINLVK